mmetsp:Transcript_25577/g.33298  ORF Transcript_25577/g.33298 Transcript_25577/m.33298 type:complete len:389 (+) Transcript_25577:117-1283(+)
MNFGLNRSQKIYAIGVIVIGALIIKISNQRIIAESTNNGKVFFLGPGCGHISYTMGFVAGLLNDDIIRNEIIRTNAKFGGVSSGGLTAAFATAVLNNVLTMDEWYHTQIRPGISAIKRKSVFGISDIVSSTVDIFYDICYNATHNKNDQVIHHNNKENKDKEEKDDKDKIIKGNEINEKKMENNDQSITSTTTNIVQKTIRTTTSKTTTTTTTTTTSSSTSGINTNTETDISSYEIPWLQDLPIAVSLYPELKPVLYMKFPNKSEFVSKFLATSYVPLMMGYKPFLFLSDNYTMVVDGFPGSLQIIWPNNYMFISFLPMQPSIMLGKHHLPQYSYDSTPGLGIIGFLRKFWPWGDLLWHDDCYYRGKADVSNNIEMYRQKILFFLNDE